MNIGSAIVKKVQSIPMPKSINTMKIKLQKNAPDIMVVAGAVIVVGSAIYACTKSVEAHDILEEANAKLKDIEYGADAADGDPGFDERIARKERMKVYGGLVRDLGRCYGPAIAGGATGLGLMLGAHKILKDRNTALTMAYANLLASYNSYRASVREELGDEREFMIRSGAKKETFEGDDIESGKKVKKDLMVVHDDGTTHSIYARIFDECNINWERSPSKNLSFIKAMQCFANDKLRAEGVVYLNDVYQMLGFPRTGEGQIIGWIWDPNNEEHDGDNYIDFGIFDNCFRKAEVRDFINGYEPCIWLDFNVDGVVYDLV